MEILRYKKQAKNWFSALPIGNGKTGVMLTGGRRVEKMYVNDGTLWSGYPNEQVNPMARAALGEVRRLVFEGKNYEADKLARQTLGGEYSEIYLPVGEVDIAYKGKVCGGYLRSLDISRAVHRTDSGKIHREAFATHVDNVVAYRATAEVPFDAVISAKSIQYRYTVEIGDNGRIYLSGFAPDKALPHYVSSHKRYDYEDEKGMAFCMVVSIETNGKIMPHGGEIRVQGATDVKLYLTTETGFEGATVMPSRDVEKLKSICELRLNAIDDYDALLSRHIADYRTIYTRQSLKLCVDESEGYVVDLLRRAKRGKVSPTLVSLYYNYGKYLTIACSREGGKASGLQGLWSYNMNPPWCAGYTVNINTEMNYWHAGECALEECLPPFAEFVYGLLETGAHTAEVNFGMRGFCCNHNVDIWAKTTPTVNQMCYMYSPLCGVWLTNELYNHYVEGGLKEYTEQVYTCVEEATRFVCDYLVEHDGYYTICPSVSPELNFYTESREVATDYGSAFELGLVRYLLDAYLAIGRDDELRREVEMKKSKLQPFSVGETGLNEWHTYFPVADKGHRHFSPLYAVYPARIICEDDSELWTAAKQLFDYRLNHSRGNIGWSGAWAMCLSAVFRDVDRAQEVIKNMFKKATFDNLFDKHPPRYFQIDGNFGFVAGVNEMLVTHGHGTIELLPALPQSWESGEIKGLRAGDCIVNMTWQKGVVTSLDIIGGKGMIKDNGRLSSEVKNKYSEILKN